MSHPVSFQIRIHSRISDQRSIFLEYHFVLLLWNPDEISWNPYCIFSLCSFSSQESLNVPTTSHQDPLVPPVRSVIRYRITCAKICLDQTPERRPKSHLSSLKLFGFLWTSSMTNLCTDDLTSSFHAFHNALSISTNLQDPRFLNPLIFCLPLRDITLRTTHCLREILHQNIYLPLYFINFRVQLLRVSTSSGQVLYLRLLW